MSNKLIIGSIIGIVVVGLAAVFFAFREPTVKVPPLSADEQAVRSVVEEFGGKMKFVSIVGATAAGDIKNYYGNLISADLLAAWQKEPIKAPGRLTSSPWPDHLEILDVEKEEDSAYIVQAKVVEMTSAGIVNQYAIGMKLRNVDGRWIITGFTKAMQAVE